MMKYKIHEVAALFPMIPKGSHAYNDLEEHIRLFGQLEPIVVDGDVLLDGRHRLAICEEHNITPKIVEWSTLGIKSEQHEWIFGKNAARRNLTEDQRAVVYTEYSNWTEIEDAKQRKAKAQFTAGDQRQNPGGKPKAVVTPNSGTPQKRDHKAKHANSTAGRIAKGAGVSRYKAAQVVAIGKAAMAGDTKAAEDFEAIKRGLKTIGEVAKTIKAAANPPPNKLARETKAQLLTEFDRAIEAAPNLDPAIKRRIVKIGMDDEALAETPKVVISTNGSTYSVFNTKEHLTYARDRMERMNCSSPPSFRDWLAKDAGEKQIAKVKREYQLLNKEHRTQFLQWANELSRDYKTERAAA